MVKQHLAWRELAPVDIFIFAHAIHQPLGPKEIHSAEGTCHNIVGSGKEEKMSEAF